MDEHDGVVTLATTSVSEPSVSVSESRGDETLIEGLGSEGQIDVSLCGGDEAEIMVEVVGSDVFVERVNGSGGDGGGEVGDDGFGKEGLEREFGGFSGGESGMANLVLPESWDSGDQVLDGRPEIEVGGLEEIPGSVGEQFHDDVADKLEVGAGLLSEQTEVEEKTEDRLSEQGRERGLGEETVDRGLESVDAVGVGFGELTSKSDSVARDEVWNPGIEAAVESSACVVGSSSAQPQDVGMRAVVMIKEEDLNCKLEVWGGDVLGAAVPRLEDHQNPEVDVVCVGTDKDSAVYPNTESVDQLTVAGGERGETNGELMSHPTVEVFEANTIIGNHQLKAETGGERTVSVDNIHGDSILSHELTKIAAGDDLYLESGTITKQIRAASGSHVVADDKVASDSGAQVYGRGEVLSTENKMAGGSNVISVGVEDQNLRVETLQDSSESVVAVCRVPETENAALCGEPESSNLRTPMLNDNEVGTIDGNVSSPKVDFPINDDMNEVAPCSENSPTVKCVTTFETAAEDGIVCKATEFSNEKASVAKTGEDLEVESVDGNTGNDVVAHGHLASSAELTEIADNDDIAVTDIGLVAKFEDGAEGKDGQAIFDKLDSLGGDLLLSEVDESMKAGTVFGCTGDEVFVQADAGTSMGYNLVSARERPVTNEKKLSDSEIEVVNGDTCLQKDQKLNVLTGDESIGEVGVAQIDASSDELTGSDVQTEISGIECQGIEALASDSVDRNISLSSKEGLKVATVDVDKVDSFVGKDMPLGADVGDHGTSFLGTKSDNLQENTKTHNGKEKAVAELAELCTHEADEIMTQVNVDEMLNQETFGTALSNTLLEAATGSQPTNNCASFHSDEGDPVSCSVGDFSFPITGGSSCNTNDNHVMHTHVSEAKEPNIGQEEETDKQYTNGMVVDSQREQEEESEDHTTEADQSDLSKLTTLEPGYSVRGHQPNYLLPPENEGDFSVSDLVWGKVRSHPWWPGQIFDPADASEKAVKHHKKDCFLVAYFGDRTFAWNDSSLLKPFRLHYFQIEKQGNSEAFHHAVSCALEEVYRRVELGLACSCIPKDAYDKIESQVVENTGIRQESSRRYGRDKSTEAHSFEPDKLVEYIRALAQSPSGGVDQLELVIAKAQLSSLCRFKGCRQLPEYQFCGGLLESAAVAPQSIEEVELAASVSKEDEQVISSKGKLKSENDSFHKRKHDLTDSVYPSKKEKSLSELGDVIQSPDADRRGSIYAAKVSAAAPPIPKPSFKVGECIRRVASQLTGSPSFRKSDSDQPALDVPLQSPENFPKEIMSAECSSIDEMLSHLHLAARDPMKGYSFSNAMITFFSGFRSSVVLNQSSGRKSSSVGRSGSGRKRKSSQGAIGSPEEFEFDDVNDSYWTDRIVQNYSEEQLLPNGENGGGEYQMVSFEPDKSQKSTRRSHPKKRYSTAKDEVAPLEPAEYIDERQRASSPTELLMNFAQGDPVPSLANLNKTFRRFGPLMESETEVDREGGRGRVVFKRGSDAEVAFGSAGKFSIFGPVIVNYQLNYSPSIAYKPLPLAIAEGMEEVT